MAAFGDMEASLADRWPLGPLQVAFVPQDICPPGGLHTAAGLAILSAGHLVRPQALEQVCSDSPQAKHRAEQPLRTWGFPTRQVGPEAASMPWHLVRLAACTRLQGWPSCQGSTSCGHRPRSRCMCTLHDQCMQKLP